ncbi:MAG: DUF3467 domain-containing protein [Acidobacteriota bacterium]|nr:MAG: DUF3467 domain-containing protein [Acidobacteriota bacterium]
MPDNVKKPTGPAQIEVKIKADDDNLFGTYSTMAQINHTAEEFTFNFIYVVPNSPVGKLLSAIILSPGHAKRFLKALEDNIHRYETTYGEIRTQPSESDPQVGFVQ